MTQTKLDEIRRRYTGLEMIVAGHDVMSLIAELDRQTARAEQAEAERDALATQRALTNAHKCEGCLHQAHNLEDIVTCSNCQRFFGLTDYYNNKSEGGEKRCGMLKKFRKK